MKAKPTAIILAGAVLAGICLVGIVALVAGGAAAWWALGPVARAPVAQGVTPLAATPVRPVLATPTRPAAIQPPATITTTQALTVTPGVDETPGAAATLDPLLVAPAATEPGETTPVAGPTYASLARDSSCIPANRPSVQATVRRVIDGVTIEVLADDQIYEVSYIGAALPDYSDDDTVWTRSQEANARLVEGKTVLLVQDRTDRDTFGRRPRYVIAGGLFVNHEMIRSGHATAADNPPDLSCAVYLLEAEQQAVTAQRGLWAPESTATRDLIPSPTATVAVTGPLQITGVSKRGTLWQEPEEFVEFRNDSQASIQLEGWTLQDDERHIFTFPAFALGPGEYCRVYTNEYHPSSCGFSYESLSPIWDNLTECAYLKDPYGELISTFCYGFQ